MRNRSSIWTLAFGPLDIDVNPLPIAAALGELVDDGLIHRQPIRYPKFASGIFRYICASDFSHGEPPCRFCLCDRLSGQSSKSCGRRPAIRPLSITPPLKPTVVALPAGVSERTLLRLAMTN